MGIANEAAYLYVHSKELLKLNKKITKYTKKAQKHAAKHIDATNENKKHKHKGKHLKAKKTLEKLMKEHNSLLTKLKHHQSAYAHALQKEHKI